MAIGDKKPVVMESDRAVPSGIATLGADGKLLDAQIPGLDKLGAAPAGYGLGNLIIASISDVAEILSFVDTGWYGITATAEMQGGKLALDGIPFNALGLHVERLGYYYAIQTVTFLDQSVITRILTYSSAESTWSPQPWEWVNPPMDLGKEYRTTERLWGRPVYKRFIDLGALPNPGSREYPIADEGFPKDIAFLLAETGSVGGVIINIESQPWGKVSVSGANKLIVEITEAVETTEMIFGTAIVHYTKQ